jgi:hypothetical protein
MFLILPGRSEIRGWVCRKLSESCSLRRNTVPSRKEAPEGCGSSIKRQAARLIEIAGNMYRETAIATPEAKTAAAFRRTAMMALRGTTGRDRLQSPTHPAQKPTYPKRNKCGSVGLRLHRLTKPLIQGRRGVTSEVHSFAIDLLRSTRHLVKLAPGLGADVARSMPEFFLHFPGGIPNRSLNPIFVHEEFPGSNDQV